ncbi:DUF3515 domain-containing protein [Cellulomonas soli]
MTPLPLRLRTAVGVGALGIAALLSACTSAVPVDVAPSAADPVCAEVVLALPEELGDGLAAVDTTAQATKAWGSPAHPVVLRCGVEPLGPTTDRCVSVETPGGPTVDWVVVPDDAAAATTGTSGSGESGWTFTTYGREPAVEVYVPAEVAAERSTSFVDLLGPAVARTQQVRTCL